MITHGITREVHRMSQDHVITNEIIRDLHRKTLEQHLLRRSMTLEEYRKGTFRA